MSNIGPIDRDADVALPMLMREWRSGRRLAQFIVEVLGGLEVRTPQLTEASPRFAPALDAAKGGVALPVLALMLSGVLRHATQYFCLSRGRRCCQL